MGERVTVFETYFEMPPKEKKKKMDIECLEM